jgi:thymidine phosphorylase
MSFFPQETIRRKRDGGELSREEIEAFIAALTDGSLSEGQAAAFAMAVFFQGMSPAEAGALTLAMARSGDILDWAGGDRPVLDKHSTGGVGDKVSLMLAPLLAACGADVPMISGRGLGHTGGTLDKLESIPGYNAVPDLSLLRKTVAEAHCAIIGQTAELAPADKRLYAIRDVTATVESVPLITASILSKKLAAGLQGLVMDVKVGNGAFMESLESARELARSLAATAKAAGLPLAALITDMNQPLGWTAGNAVEVAEAMDFLTGAPRERRLEEVTLALCAEALLLSGLCGTEAEARALLLSKLADGSAAEQFQKMTSLLGGPADFVERRRDYLAAAPLMRPVLAEKEGLVARIDTRGLGLLVMALGGGRRRADQAVDHAVGLTELLPLGAAVEPRTPLALVHARDEAAFEAAALALRQAYGIAETAEEPAPPVLEKVAQQ